MSHMTKVSSIKMTDLTLLEKACRNLGIDLDKSKKTYKSYYTDEIDCEAVICNKEGGEAAVVKTTEGYEIQWDSYRNSLRETIGGNCQRLTQAYSIEAVIQQANSIGMISSIETQKDGSVILQGIFI